MPVATSVTEVPLLPLDLGNAISASTASSDHHEATPLTLHSISSSKLHWNLPPVLSSLIGREQEVKEVSTLFLRSDVRILIFTGTGGVGKTRLALQVATELGPTFADGVCFVPLASVSDAAQVMPTLAHALGLQETLDSSPQEQVQEYLHNRHILLLLDNFEQVVASAPALSELLASCAALRLLVTSRVRLNIAEEQLFPVHPLALPDFASLPDREALTKVASVNLFMQQARMVQPGFELTQSNAHIVAIICSYLEGLPLAIELAAVRINLLPPQALLKRLENRLNILTSSAESRPSRHQTMRNTIQWSYDLLNTDEQQLFRRLSIFIGGFTLQAAEALHTQLDGSSEGVLHTLSSLIEKNLLRSPEEDEEDPRLGLLETIRAFALEMLQASSEYAAVKYAYMQHFLALTEEASSSIPGSQEAEWSQRLERELANLRAVMQWSLSDGKQICNMEIALRLGIALKSFWRSRGYFREGKTFLEQALAGCDGPINTLQANAMLAIVNFALLFCDYQQAQHLLEICHSYYQGQNDMAQVAVITWQLGWLANLQFRSALARTLYEEALALSRELHDEKMIDIVRYHLAFLALSEGDYQQSQVLLEESLVYRKTIGIPVGIAAALGDLAQLRRISSIIPPVEEMHRLLTESMLYAKKSEDQNIIMAVRYGIAWVSFLRGNLDEAHQLVDETIAFYKEAGKQQSLGHYLELRGRIYAAQGKDAEARATFEESIVQTTKQNDLDTMSGDLVELAYLAVEQQQYSRATRLLGVDEKMREIASLPTHPFESLHRDHVITIARAVLGQENFEYLWTEGRTISPLDALRVSDSLPTKPRSGSTRHLSYPAGLTRREVDVLHLVAQGFTDSQVAEQLVISPRTVTTHLTSIYNKLQINSRSAATNFAVKNHLA